MVDRNEVEILVFFKLCRYYRLPINGQHHKCVLQWKWSKRWPGLNNFRSKIPTRQSIIFHQNILTFMIGRLSIRKQGGRTSLVWFRKFFWIENGCASWLELLQTKLSESWPSRKNVSVCFKAQINKILPSFN